MWRRRTEEFEIHNIVRYEIFKRISSAVQTIILKPMIESSAAPYDGISLKIMHESEKRNKLFSCHRVLS
jgi:hypothetical protein